MHVAIVAMGPSADAYARHCAMSGSRLTQFDETWTVNCFGSIFHADRTFHMDDVRIQEIRAAGGNQLIANTLKWLKEYRGTVYTSRAHPDYPCLVDFPLEEVLNSTGNMVYFNSTPAYAIALAIHMKVSRISIYGMDYTFNDKYRAERGRSCIEYWIGRATERGIEIAVPGETCLMDTNRPDKLYGYDTRLVSGMLQPDGSVKLKFTERETLPTAEQIEAAYSTECGPVKEKSNGKCSLPSLQNGTDQRLDQRVVEHQHDDERAVCFTD
jgi:hypothetical protein